MSNNRRKFIQQIGALGGVGLVSATGINEVAAAINNQENSGSADADGTTTLTILQTTDVHCQVHPHDELFWENGKSVFRKTGGYAHLATFLEKEKKRNPNSFLIDTGDMFQGSELSVKTLGKPWCPF
jgi:2',3'-cyclic-nucleotide 2'-phosphodiesterase (5'-nucleotidase family)